MVQSAQLENSFYPSAKLRLIVRLDEFADTSVAASAPPKPPNVMRGTKSQRAPLVAQPDPTAPAGINRFVLQAAGAPAAPGGPQGQTTSQDKRTFALNGIIPKKCTWTQNGIRAASQLSATIKGIDCPLDPRALRAVAVELYLGSVTADDYARGIAGETRTSTQGQLNVSEPLNVIPEQYVDANGKQRSNLRFQGFVDVWEPSWDDDGEPIINIECRDNTQLLLDVESPPALVVAAGKPIDRAVADYLANFPTFAGLSVEYLPAGATPPQLGAALAGTAFQPQLGPAPARGGGATTKLMVWDYLTDVCGALGHVIRVDGTTVIIQQAATLFSSSTGPARPDDPYQPRTVDGATYAHRTFIWGRNLGRMKIRKNFSKRAQTNVEVRCYSPRRKKVLVARFPDPKSQADRLAVKALPGDGSTDQKWMVWRVRGVEDQATLKLIAQNVYVSVGRTEMQLELSTHNLTSFGGDNQLDPEILDMKAGDTFELLVAREEDYGTLEAQEDKLLSQATDFLTRLGFDQDFAAAYAAAYTNAGYQTTFRLRGMTVEWDAEDEGVSIEMHGANYVEVRADAPLAGS